MNIIYKHEKNETALFTIFINNIPMARIFETDSDFELHDKYGIHKHATLTSIVELFERIFN